LSYSIAEAERAGVQLSTAATARELFATALARGLGDMDFAAVVEPLRGT
jgi:3-hydroxyisobutyrate dehydrogenase-like beta-hydroxyacid dehydrogenase